MTIFSKLLYELLLDKLHVDQDTLSESKEDSERFEYVLSYIEQTWLLTIDEKPKLIELVKKCYNKLEKFGLTDQKYDNDPLNIFRYYAAKYLVLTIIENQNPKTTSFFHPDRKHTQDKKEKILTTNLIKCVKEYTKSQTQRVEGYCNIELKTLSEKASSVLKHITKIEEANSALCGLGVSSSGLIELVRAGKLGECMKKSSIKINAILSAETKREELEFFEVVYREPESDSDSNLEDSFFSI